MSVRGTVNLGAAGGVSSNLKVVGDRLAEFFHKAQARGGLCVVTGAGVSTESGLPDYRSKGRPPYKPIQYQQFVKEPSSRRRYWGRSYLGWEKFSGTQPNKTHEILGRLENSGHIASLITQNVDQLHQRAGSKRVIDLHGILSEVVCLDCTDRFPRDSFQDMLSEMNPEWAELKYRGALAHEDGYKVGYLPKPGEKVQIGSGKSIRPDGDVEMGIKSYDSFEVPSCPSCGNGVLKPDVVFFGENVPLPRVELGKQWVGDAPALLVIGTSLEVYSARRFVYAARDSGKEIAIVNRGPTRSDGDATIKFDGGCTEILSHVENAI